MPVGLSLLDTVEEYLTSEGLLPRDVSVVHRMIDFANRDFTLRWNSAESRGHTITVRLTQQLAQTKVAKPILNWVVFLDDGDVYHEEGRLLLDSTVRPRGLPEAVFGACSSLLDAATSASSGEEPAS